MTGAIDYRHVSILWASPEHAEELAQLHAGLFEKPWDADSFSRLLQHPGSTSFLARVGTPPQTVGFIVSQLAADEAEILTLGVRKDSQRHGIARRLVEALARAARKAEVRRLFLEVGQTMPPRSRSTRGSASSRSGSARATTSTPARRPRMRWCWRSRFEAAREPSRSSLRRLGASPITAPDCERTRFAQPWRPCPPHQSRPRHA